MGVRNFLLALFFSCGITLHAQIAPEMKCLDTIWNRSFESANEIISVYNQCAQDVDKDEPYWRLLNDCSFIWNGGMYINNRFKVVDDIALILDNAPNVSLDNPIVRQYMEQKGVDLFMDYYCILKYMKNGDSFDNSRDGLIITTRYPMRKPNYNDFKKLTEIFSGDHSALHQAYMERLLFVFQNNGCMEEMLPLRELIEKNVKESPLKEKVLSCYHKYASLMQGLPAPLPLLRDASGKEHSFAEFKGKVVVVDIWASWCCACLEKIPKYKLLKKEFEGNKDVVFIMVSIDRRKSRSAWLKAIEKHEMQDFYNWSPDADYTSEFETAYLISGIPRYLIIDKEGKLISAYAPSPDHKMKELILETLK